MDPALHNTFEKFVAEMSRQDPTHQLATQMVELFDNAIKAALVKEFGPDVPFLEAIDQCRRIINAGGKAGLNQIVRIEGVNHPKILFEWKEGEIKYSFDPATNTAVATSTIRFA